MKLSTILIAIISILAGAWLLNAIFKFSAWLSGMLTYVIAIAIVIGLIWLYIKFRNRGKKPADQKSAEK